MGSGEGPKLGPYRALLDALPDGVLVATDKGGILVANQTAQAMFGYRQDELVGRPVELLVPDALRLSGDRRRRARERAGPTPSGEELSVTTACRRKDGEEFSADVGLRPIQTELGPLIVTSIRDATERRRAEDRLQAVMEISRAVLEGAHPEVVLGQVARRARELVDAELAVVVALDTSGASYRVKAADGANAELLLGAALEPERSLAARAASGTRTDTTVQDVGLHPGAESYLAQLVDAGPIVVVPLPGNVSPSASLAAVRNRGRPQFSPSDIRLIELFAAQAAVALDYVDVRDDLQRLAIVAERDRIGRELHDGAIQALFSVGIGLQGTEMLSEDPMLRARLEIGVRQIDTVIRDLRNYIFGLRPGGLSGLPLDHALYELADRFQREHGMATTVEADGGLAAELAALASDLLQLTREALSNVAKHSSARSCAITLRRLGDQALLEIEDDGRGFATDQARGRGWGLRNMEERAAGMGGRIEIESAAGAGTTIRLLVPR